MLQTYVNNKIYITYALKYKYFMVLPYRIDLVALYLAYSFKFIQNVQGGGEWWIKPSFKSMGNLLLSKTLIKIKYIINDEK